MPIVAGVLSGGEKARVALALFALLPCNVLLLDEASNHLDAATIDVLTGALQKFEGGPWLVFICGIWCRCAGFGRGVWGSNCCSYKLR